MTLYNNRFTPSNNMSTITPTSNKTNLDRNEVARYLTAITNCNSISQDKLFSIKESAESILDLLGSTITETSTQYQKIAAAKNKVIQLSEILKHDLEQGDERKIAESRELYEVWVDNLLLNFDLLLADTKNSELRKNISSDHDNTYNNANFTSDQKNNIGIAASIRGAISTSAAENFVQKLPSYLAQLPTGICIAMGKDLVFQFANAKYLEIVDKDNSIIGSKISDTLTDIDSQ